MRAGLSPDVPQKLSQLLMALHLAGDNSPVADFQSEALRLLQQSIPFDSALWAAGVLQQGQQPVIRNVCLFNQRPAMLESYERVKGLDPVLHRAVAQFGTTVNWALAHEAWPPGTEAMKAHGEQFGMQHILATMTRGPVSQLLGAISLYRGDASRPFSEEERLIQQSVVPHLVELFDRSRLRHVEALLRPPQEHASRAVGLVDRDGLLYNVSADFVRLLLDEWPDWQGPLVPAILVNGIGSRKASPMRLKKIAVRASPVNDLLLLRVRPIAPGDEMSRREWDVARLFGDGKSHKEIAKDLRIAPSTVRNHLKAVYKKLHVTNKAELVHSLDSVGG
jgi:DNA-binding CsgD family transcriptional regulator